MSKSSEEKKTTGKIGETKTWLVNKKQDLERQTSWKTKFKWFKMLIDAKKISMFRSRCIQYHSGASRHKEKDNKPI